MTDDFKLDDDDIEEVRNPLASNEFNFGIGTIDVAVKSQGP